jgi:magnesium-transporting ATPase (P-type)
LIAYTAQTLYSGTPLFDQWIIAVLNFVAGIPIIVLGLFDRCMDKSYVRRHPEVYKPTRNNELLTIRTQLRWICLVFVHIFTIYYMTVPTLAREGGGITSAFLGLMRNKGFDSPGDGEAGDLKSVGTVTFSCLITLLAYKVIVRGETCSGLLSL